MAVIRTHGFTASCSDCGWWGKMWTSRNAALVDERNHDMHHHLKACPCYFADGEVSHRTECPFAEPPSEAT